MATINRVFSVLSAVNNVNSMLSRKSSIIRVCAALLISSIYLGWFKNHDYLGEEFGDDTTLFRRIHLVHKPFFDNLVRMPEHSLQLTMEDYAKPYSMLDWFNVFTLGYFALWMKNYFTTSFSFPFLLSIVPFEYFFIYDFISTGKHLGLTTLFENLFYYLLVTLIIIRVFRDCKHGLSDVESSNPGGPFSSIQDYWTIVKGVFTAIDRSWNLGLSGYFSSFFSFDSMFNQASGTPGSNGAQPNIDPSIFMNSFMGGNAANNPFMNLGRMNASAGGRMGLQDFAEIMRRNSDYYSGDDDSDGPVFSDVSVE